MSLETSIDGDMAGMDHAIAGPTHSNTVRPSALGSRQRHQGSAARIEGIRTTSDEDKADNCTIRCGTPLPQPVATARLNENRSHDVRQVYRTSKQASGVIRAVNALGYTQLVDDDDRWQIVNDALS